MKLLKLKNKQTQTCLGCGVEVRGDGVGSADDDIGEGVGGGSGVAGWLWSSQSSVGGYICTLQLINSSNAGGLWLVTDMRRGESIYELEPSVAEEVENGIESEGSNLSGVSSRIVWTETEMGGILAPLSVHSLKAQTELESESMPHITHVESEQIKTTLQKGLLQGGKSCSTQGKEASEGNVEGNVATSDSAELFVTRRLESLHLTINLESGALLPLALR
ncbi:Suppressor of fused [Portunus trituberculatus]|uniref:Suppressor of fused n=1 Tax=Portunus trituberculatus TaxID=210409 RepID=A0A5B7FR70_PORTR|nr:Suppressor of fused [Portunus trituberculatus]